MSDHGSGDGLHNTHSLGVPVFLSPGEHSQLAHGSIEKPFYSCVPIFSVQVICNQQHDLTTTMKTEAMANIMNSKIKTFYNALILMTTNENILQCIYFGKKAVPAEGVASARLGESVSISCSVQVFIDHGYNRVIMIIWPNNHINMYTHI